MHYLPTVTLAVLAVMAAPAMADNVVVGPPTAAVSVGGSDHAVVIGDCTTADTGAVPGAGGIAFGDGAASNNGAIVFGKGSTGNGLNIVSFGDSGTNLYRQLTNIADGTGANDAVTLGQMNTAIASAVSGGGGGGGGTV